MGIQGLLPFLKKIHTPVNIAQFEGYTVAIDAYCWLHKGAFSCAEKLAMGEKTDQYVYYCMKFIENMLKKKIKPIMVFDGCHLPSKKDVEKSRREKREMNRKKAAQLLREGKRSEARDCLQRCIDISPEMALELMNVCRSRGVDCIVAPYEADAQLAYLNKAGIAQIVVTEDSDLLLFGCEKVIFKMDHFGSGMMIERSRLNEVLEIQNGFYTFEKFRRTCILSGCDYLPSLPGIGLVKACKVFKIARQEDIRQLLKKIPTYLKMSLTVTEQYLDGFVQADNTFLYQLCYDPLIRKLVPLNPYPDDIQPDDLTYAGAYIPEKKAYQLALGNINIYTKEIFADFDPSTYVPPKANPRPKECLHLRSIWDKNYRIRPKIGLSETQNIDRPNLHGKEVQISNKTFKRKSPQKRKLCADIDEKEVKSDKELSHLYNTEDSITLSPEKKKSRISSDNTSDSLKYEAVPLFHVSPVKDCVRSSSPEAKKASPKPRLSKSPRKQFFASLVEADSEGLHSSEESCIKNSANLSKSKGDDDTVEEEKENNIVSPRRNKFAVLSSQRKPRFDLNASKEVKSRFFLSTSEKDGSNSKETDSCNQSQSSVEQNQSPVKQNQSPVKQTHSPVGQTQTSVERLNDSCYENTISQSKEIVNRNSHFEKPNDSPSGSAFSWSRFKFSRCGSSSDVKTKSNTTANKQFKRVVSDSNLKQYFNKKETVESEENGCSYLSAPVDQTSSQLSTDTDVSLSQQSSYSNLYSIDSECMPDSEELRGDFETKNKKEDNEKLEVDSIYTKSYKSDVCSMSDNTMINKSSTNVSTEKVPDKMSGKIPGSTAKPGCRVSGLSKGKKSKNAKTVVDSNKQQNIKDLFSKFAHNKSDIKKLKPTSRSEDDDDVEIVAVTPCSQDRNAFDITGGVQRKILP